MSKPRVILYTRVSSDQQVDNTSLDQQEKIGKEYCKRMNYELVQVFREEGESAKFIDRTKLKEALGFCAKKKNNVTFFIVYKYDRFSRSLENHVIIKAMLSKASVRLLSISEQVDESPSGRLMENILASFAQFDNEVRTERTVNGMRAKLEQGYWTWRPPLGYIRDASSTERHKPIIPDSSSFKFIKEGWKMLLSKNYKPVEIQKYLKDRGVLITLKQLSKLFRNRFYAGIIFSDKFNINIKGKHEPMISDVEYFLAQEILGENNQNRIGTLDVNDEFYLAKIVRCCGCDKLLSGCYSKGKFKYYGYYQCGDTKCPARQFLPKTKIEENFADVLKTITPPKEDLELFKEVVVDAYSKNYKDVFLIHEQKEKELEKYKKQMKKLKDLLEDDTYTKEEYHERKLVIEANMVGCKAELSETNMEVAEMETCINYVTKFIEDLPTFWIRLYPKERIKLNNIIFPNGLNYENGAYRTPQTHSIYGEIQSISSAKNDELTSRRIELRLVD